MKSRSVVAVLWSLAVVACASAGPATTVNRPMPRGVVFHGAFDRFPIAGSSEREIGQSLRAAGVREGGFLGHYRASWRWRYQIVEGGAKAGCRFNNVRIDIESAIRIPEWQQPPDAPAQLVTEWQTFNAALDDHEREHERLNIQMAGDLVRRLEQMSDLSCRQLQLDGDRLAKEQVAQMNARQAKFDADTNHGANAGVRWPPAPPPPPATG